MSNNEDPYSLHRRELIINCKRDLLQSLLPHDPDTRVSSLAELHGELLQAEPEDMRSLRDLIAHLVGVIETGQRPHFGPCADCNRAMQIAMAVRARPPRNVP